MEKTREQIMKMLQKYKVIAILRRIPMNCFLETADAVYRGGIRLMEVPFDQSGELSAFTIKEQIQSLSMRYPDAAVGAGTVLYKEQVDMAREGGASYIISPNTDKEVIAYTRKCGLISIPGALTPTEMQNAYSWGADYVKLFPAGTFGIDYLKDIMAPLRHIKFLAVGRINAENIGDFLKAGCTGAGVGSCLLDENMIRDGRYKELEELAGQYAAYAQSDGEDDI